MALEVERGGAKAAKDALKSRGWLDATRTSRLAIDRSKVMFALTMPGVEALREILEEEGALDRIGALAGATLVSLELPEKPRSGVAPRLRMETEVLALLRERGLDESLVKELPLKWERVGNLAILPENSLQSETWSSLGDSLWRVIAACLGVDRVARQGPIASTETRDSRVEMLLGEDGWVEHRENSISYCFDATKCMFSSGNVTERSRMGRLNCEDDVVVDLFAGIGYFVLPFLVGSRARHVYACEWNPQALYALRWNLRVNGVEKRCTIIEGDNRLVTLQAVADRVCLGLLPSSERSWAVAVRALKPEGGILHIHENVKDINEEQWLKYLIDALKLHAVANGRNWNISVLHVERVKWYAPHIRHIVVDVDCNETRENGGGFNTS